MTYPILSWSIISAVLYGGWHALVKFRSHSLVCICLGQLLSGFICLMLCISMNIHLFTQECVNLIIISGAVHALYLYLLTAAYNMGELSIIFPVSRALGLFFIFAFSFSYESLTFQKNLGFFLILLGSFFINFYKNAKIYKNDLALSFLIGTSIAGYSFIDRYGVDFMHPFFLSSSISFSTGFFLLLLLAFKKENLRDLKEKRKDFLFGFTVGISGLIIYSTFLHLMNFIPLSYAIANRQLSILIAYFIGIFFFKEKSSFQKAICLIFLSLGIYLLNK